MRHNLTVNEYIHAPALSLNFNPVQSGLRMPNHIIPSPQRYFTHMEVPQIYPDLYPQWGNSNTVAGTKDGTRKKFSLAFANKGPLSQLRKHIKLP